jgi:predicted dehydrogenase
MSGSLTRREIVRGSFAAGIALGTSGARAARPLPAGEKVNVAVVGVANRGRDNLSGVAKHNVVAVCDVDEKYLASARDLAPNAKTYTDWRKMLEQNDIEAVVVATPDHNHAVITASALKSGRHVYCEKPLTHTVHEARYITELARKQGRITQMGTQIHSGDNYRRVVEIVQSGAIGKVTDVHVWVGNAYGNRPRPVDTPPVPEHLHYDIWLGPAPARPYHPTFVPFWWRGFWDYGGGSLADMACHHMDLSFWALGLHAPTHISAEGPEHDIETTPTWLIVKYKFPEVNLTWYHGGRKPEMFEDGTLPEWGDGTLFIGTKGMMLAGYNRYRLLPEKDYKGYTPPPKTIASSPGQHEEWLNAVKGNGKPLCHFDYAGPLTETVLLGNAAFRHGSPIEWDSKTARITNAPEANRYLTKEYRKGWSLP